MCLAVGLVRGHRLLAGLLAVAAALRVIALFAYRPALIFPDTIYYVQFALHPSVPGNVRVTGYSLLLAPVVRLHQLSVVPLAQHLMGLAAAVLLYALLLRLGCRRGWCVAAVIPVLFDPMQLVLEQYVLTDVVFVFFAVVALAALAWNARRDGPGTAGVITAGLAVAAASLIRADGVVLAVAAIGYVAVAVRPRKLLLIRCGALAAAVVLPLAGYVGWYHATRGPWSVTSYSGRFLYGRVATFADCTGMALPSYERALCPYGPPAHRDQNFYMWSNKSPQWRYRPPPGIVVDAVIGDFARRVIEHQPLTYAKVVATDFGSGFAPVRGAGPEGYNENYLRFGTSVPYTDVPEVRYALKPFGWTWPYIQPQLARFLRGYGVLYTPGPLLALALAIGLAGAIGLGRARRSPLRPVCFLFTAATLLAVLPAAVLSTFDWRYQLPQIVLAPAAGVLGGTAIRWRGRSQDAPAAAAAAEEAAPVPAQPRSIPG
jgi:hypothetical protein